MFSLLLKPINESMGYDSLLFLHLLYSFYILGLVCYTLFALPPLILPDLSSSPSWVWIFSSAWQESEPSAPRARFIFVAGTKAPTFVFYRFFLPLRSFVFHFVFPLVFSIFSPIVVLCSVRLPSPEPLRLAVRIFRCRSYQFAWSLLSPAATSFFPAQTCFRSRFSCFSFSSTAVHES
jgi:hypothetical protein